MLKLNSIICALSLLSLSLVGASCLVASETVLFGFQPRENLQVDDAVLPVFISEGAILNKAFLPDINLVEDGTYIYDPFAERAHPDKVGHVVLQIDRELQMGGASVDNLKRPAIFNHSCGPNYKILDSSEKIVGYSGQKEITYRQASFPGFTGLKEDHPLDKQLHIKSAGNNFFPGETSEHFDPDLFHGAGYIAFIKGMIRKFGEMIIFCSELNLTGQDLKSTSSRPLLHNHAPYYICCPSPIQRTGEAVWLKGTSYSAPMVSGVAAKLKRDFPHLCLREIRDIILFSAAKSHLCFDSATNNFQTVLLNGRRFGNGMLNCENAYTLAEILSHYKKGKGPVAPSKIHSLAKYMPKQFILFPVLDPNKDILNLEGWMRTIITDKPLLVVKNIVFILSAIKYKDESKIGIIHQLVKRFIEEAHSLEDSYAYLYKPLDQLFSCPHLFMRPWLMQYYSLHAQTISRTVSKDNQVEVFARFILVGFDLTSDLPVKMVAKMASLEGFPHLEDYQDYIDYMKMLTQSDPLELEIEGTESLRKRYKVDVEDHGGE